MKRTDSNGEPRERIAPTYGTARSRREKRQREAAERQARYDANPGVIAHRAKQAKLKEEQA